MLMVGVGEGCWLEWGGGGLISDLLWGEAVIFPVVLEKVCVYMDSGSDPPPLNLPPPRLSLPAEDETIRLFI